MSRKFLSQLQSIIDFISGVQPFQPLPESFFKQTDWTLATQALSKPAAWRRQARVR
jgi:hypothetical protein